MEAISAFRGSPTAHGLSIDFSPSNWVLKTDISSLWDNPFLNLLYRIFTANSICTQKYIQVSLRKNELGSLSFDQASAIQIAQLLNIIFRDHFRILSLPLFLLAHTSQDCQGPSELPLDSKSDIRI
jgi:hypothetical protein